MALTTAELMLVEQRVTNDGPSTGTAYLLWLFLWFVSGHRFYLGRPVSAVLQILSYFVVIGFVWILVDAFLIPEMIRNKRNEVRSSMMRQLAGAY